MTFLFLTSLRNRVQRNPFWVLPLILRLFRPLANIFGPSFFALFFSCLPFFFRSLLKMKIEKHSYCPSFFFCLLSTLVSFSRYLLTPSCQFPDFLFRVGSISADSPPFLCPQSPTILPPPLPFTRRDSRYPPPPTTPASRNLVKSLSVQFCCTPPFPPPLPENVFSS